MDPRQHLSASILRIIDNQVMYRDMKLGQIVEIRGIDLSDKTERSTFLQLVYYKAGDDAKKETVVFSVIDKDFSFTSSEGQPTPVKIGTLAMAGLSMQWLPSPVYQMVLFGGIGVGRDYSLEYADKDGEMLIIPRISQITLWQPAEFTPPEGTKKYLERVARLEKKKKEAESPENLARYRGEYMEWLKNDLGDDFNQIEHLLPELKLFCIEGLYSIGDFLSKAHDQGKLQPAILRVEEGIKSQWNYQPPSVRAHPHIGSNENYLSRCCYETGVEWVSNEKTKIPDDADERYQYLREVLESGINSNDEMVDLFILANQKAGQLAILNTVSGNHYLVEVVDPDAETINLVGLKQRTGLRRDGYYQNLKSSNPAVGKPLKTPGIHTSAIQTIYVISR